jgi:ribosomal protein L32
MANHETQTATKLEAVHVCEKCETRSRPHQVNEDVNVTGVVECKVCSHVGPLRILILPQESELTHQS